MLPGANLLCWLDKVRVLLANNAPINIQFILPDQNADGAGTSLVYQIPAPFGGNARYDVSLYDASFYPVEQAFIWMQKIEDAFNGQMIAVEITQNDNDPNLQVMTSQIQYTFESGNFI